MVVETYCLRCKSSDEIKIEIRQMDMNNPVEVWLVCKCGEQHYLGDEGELV